MKKGLIGIVALLVIAIIIIGVAVTGEQSDVEENAELTAESTQTDAMLLYLEDCNSLGELSEKMASDDNVNGLFEVASKAHYKQDGKEDIVYSIGYDGWMLVGDIVEKSSEAKAENRISKTGEVLLFDISACGNKCTLGLCNDGYLYISCGLLSRAFDIGVDRYEEFMKDFAAVSCVYTEENPVTIG